MGDGGLGEVDATREVLDAEFGARERVEDPHARGVAQDAERLCERDDRIIVQSVLGWRRRGLGSGENI